MIEYTNIYFFSIFYFPTEGNIEMLKGKDLRKSRMHAIAFHRICDYSVNNFPLGVMLWALLFFFVITKLEETPNQSETWKHIQKNASFKKYNIHAYLEAPNEGEFDLYKNFTLAFTKSISTNLKALCEDCSLALQSKTDFKDTMPYPFNKQISDEFLITREEEKYSYVSFKYERPIITPQSMEMVDPRVLEKITNKETKRLTVYFTMQSPHLSYRALNLAHNLVIM